MRLAAAISYHKADEKRVRYAQLQAKREERAKSGRTLNFRRRKNEPPFAVVEQALLPTLLALPTDAIRVYVTLCRFANGKTGLAYPSKRKLLHRLGAVPFHTNFLTGVTNVGLTKAQKLTRQRQLERFNAQLQQALDELVDAGLVAHATKSIATADGATEYKAFRILRPDGRTRRISDLKYRRAFFIVPACVFDCGAFAIRSPQGHSYLRPLDARVLRLLLLALRDNDEQRYGGIDPATLSYEDGNIVLNRNAWPVELTFSVPECVAAVAELQRLRLLKTTTGVFSRKHGQLIDPDRNLEDSQSEVVRTIYRIA